MLRSPKTTGLIATFIRYKRTVLMLTVLVLINGFVALNTITKENFPDISFPVLYISVGLDGISVEDAETLLIRPLESELASTPDLKKTTAIASEGHAGIQLEFFSGTDMQTAKTNTQERIDRAQGDLPEDANEPTITEINVSLFPIFSVALTGAVEEKILHDTAVNLADTLENISGVLEANIAGEREEVVEVVIDIEKLNSLGISIDTIQAAIDGNNSLVPAGVLDLASGRYPVKVPGLLETAQQFLQLPIANLNGEVIVVRDVANVERTFKDPTTISRFNHTPTLVVDVSRRIGANLLDTVVDIRTALDGFTNQLPAGVDIVVVSDASIETEEQLDDLFNNVIFSTILVVFVVAFILGIRNAVFVSFTIPASFLIALMALQLFGLTLNMVVLFALIMSVGILVDSAIVVIEYADRRMLQGHTAAEAFAEASQKMGPPVIASTATTLAVFVPLMFWPDTIGEFMKFLPITIITTLTASLLVSLVIIPVLGSIFGKPGGNASRATQIQQYTESGDVHQLRGFTRLYVQTMDVLMEHPFKVLATAVWFFVMVFVVYGTYGSGTVFFPEGEPSRGQVSVLARGDLSLQERDVLVAEVEQRLQGIPAIKSINTKVYASPPSENSRDMIGLIALELVDWRARDAAKEVFDTIRVATSSIAGIKVKTTLEQNGPPSPADVIVEVKGNNEDRVIEGLERLRAVLTSAPAFYQIEDSRPLPGVEWQIAVDRDEVAKYNVTMEQIGNMVKLITGGFKITDYIPDDSQDKIDVVARLPESRRNFDEIDQLRIVTQSGDVPLSNFIERVAQPKAGELTKVDGKITYTLQGDVLNSFDKPSEVAQMVQKIQAVEMPVGTSVVFLGDQDNQQKSTVFLAQAFGIAFFMMLVILVTQFNSILQALLILSAIVFSVSGVFIGLMIRGEPFGIVMSGVGIIALAGIVVNNNIILLETYNDLRRTMPDISIKDAILRTCGQRMRPVIMTSFTTVVGLAPMVLQININMIDSVILLQPPSSLWWVQLATAVAGGLALSTFITMLLTPCLLYASENITAAIQRRRHTGEAATIAGV